jgi:hypothetical protein
MREAFPLAGVAPAADGGAGLDPPPAKDVDLGVPVRIESDPRHAPSLAHEPILPHHGPGDPGGIGRPATEDSAVLGLAGSGAQIFKIELTDQWTAGGGRLRRGCGMP